MLTVQGLIWIVEPDALEVWMERSAFGKLHGTEGYRTFEQQEENFLKALIDVGVEA
jgi:hypothetical protein